MAATAGSPNRFWAIALKGAMVCGFGMIRVVYGVLKSGQPFDPKRLLPIS
ncbi:hypothetical protein CKA32_002499 [Geitlerinema sp. FC II]|nr:hypothetical protein CKA32_002499 [Geitlerinema sp. FC II]